MKTLTNILIVLLLIVAFAMIYLGINSGILPPTLTGVGFIVIAALYAIFAQATQK